MRARVLSSAFRNAPHSVSILSSGTICSSNYGLQHGQFITDYQYFQRRFQHHQQTQWNGSGDRRDASDWRFHATLGLGALTFTGYLVWKNTPNVALLDSAGESTLDQQSERRLPNLPEYSRNDVAEHYDATRRIWVSFRRGVYDVTDFISVHPGGSRILMAAGGSLEPFWELYPVHQTKEVFKILEKYRIGNLREEDMIDAHETVDHFEDEPMRHPALIRRSQKPFNGETPPSLLKEMFYTPNGVFYVRNHLPVPKVDAKTYRLEIDGLNLKETALSLDDLKKLPKVSISATIQCGGNRRTEMGKDKSVAGLAWTGGAIGNAKWTGVKLIDVLKLAGFQPNTFKNPERLHIRFDGMDMDQSGECYGASIPFSYLLDANFDAILAYEMNDKPLPIDHGFPIRIVLPGIVGARSVKWLGKISISDEESHSPWQQRDYKVFSPSVTLETVDFSSAPAIMDTPVTSYICSHETGDKVKKGPLKLQGYAFSGGGRKIIRVEISIDKGKTWRDAQLLETPAVNGNEQRAKNWSWVLWEANLNLQQSMEIWVKAVDSGYNQQPENFNNIWNYRGLLSTAYHKIYLQVK